MAVTILERPICYKMSSESPVTLVEDYGGLALVNVTAHGLSDGNIVYLLTNKERYNGFFKVSTVIDADSFTIKDFQNVEIFWVADAEGTVTHALFQHPFSCVHLPITYKISSNLAPVSDAFATVASFSNSSGNTSLVFTGAFTGGGVSAQNTHVKIVGSNVDGIYRIVDTTVTLIIDLPYDVANTLVGAVVYVYYNNYHVRVQVYGGLSDVHFWNAEKPYELLSTLKLIPDNDNEIKFSVAKELKAKVKSLTNNLALNTLPNDIDAYTMFYITTQESYDEYDEDGEIVTHTEDIEEDSSELVAANAKLPFKNIYSGFLSDYIVTNTVLLPAAKFLTLFEQPSIFEGYFFDIGAYIYGSINDVINYMSFVTTCLDENGDPISSSQYDIPDNSLGLYRFQLEPDCDCKQLQVYLIFQQDGPTPDITERKTIDVVCGCVDGTQLTWLNYLGGMEYWVFTAQTEHQIDIKEAKTRITNLFPSWPSSYGETASTIRQETSRTSCFRKTLRSQSISLENLEAMQYIKTSSLVQIMVSEFDLRTVLVDTDSFTVYQDNDKEFSIEFNIEYTDYIPSQSL